MAPARAHYAKAKGGRESMARDGMFLRRRTNMPLPFAGEVVVPSILIGQPIMTPSRAARPIGLPSTGDVELTGAHERAAKRQPMGARPCRTNG